MKSQVQIIAEIASAHEGNIDLLKSLILKSSKTGADFVKVQIYNFNELVHKVDGVKSNLEGNELSVKEWIEVIEFSGHHSINLIAEVYDLKSFEITKSRNEIFGYKIPTADINNHDLLLNVAKESKPIFLGIGGANVDEISDSISIINKYPSSEIILMHGIQSFPTKIEDCLLQKLVSLKEMFNLKTGYADHIDAEDTIMSFTVPAIAVSLGAHIIEKHITPNRAKKSFDYFSALNPDEFTRFVAYMHDVHLCVGKPNGLSLNDAEIEYRNKMKKFAILKNNVSKGDKLSSVEVYFKRVNLEGISRRNFLEFKDSRFNKDLEAGSPIKKEYLDA